MIVGVVPFDLPCNAIQLWSVQVELSGVEAVALVVVDDEGCTYHLGAHDSGFTQIYSAEFAHGEVVLECAADIFKLQVGLMLSDDKSIKRKGPWVLHPLPEPTCSCSNVIH